MITERTRVMETRFGVFSFSIHVIDDVEIYSLECRREMWRTPIVRIHSGCIWGDALFSTMCDCGPQLAGAFESIRSRGRGVIVYSPSQEGRGHGLAIKCREHELRREHGINTIQALKMLQREPDVRAFHREVAALRELELCDVIDHFSGNPRKTVALEAGGFRVVSHVEQCHGVGAGGTAERLLKEEHLGYKYAK